MAIREVYNIIDKRYRANGGDYTRTCNSRHNRMLDFSNFDNVTCENNPAHHVDNEKFLFKRRLVFLCVITLIVGSCFVLVASLSILGPDEDDKMLSESRLKFPRVISERSTTNNTSSPWKRPVGGGEFLKLPRIAEHCHLPGHPTVGMEGFFLKGKYTLEQVHIIFSSGETTPQQLHPNLPLADCRYDVGLAGANGDFPGIVNAYIRANKGRTEFSDHTVSQSKKCPPGQLSPLGFAKLRQVGMYLKDTYSTLLEKESRLSHPDKWIQVLSSPESSSFHSTLAVLRDFLPPSELHRVHIEKSHHNLCNYGLSECYCQSTEKLAIQMAEVSQKSTGSSSGRFLNNFSKRNVRAVDALAQLSPLVCDKNHQTAGCHGKRCWNVTKSNVWDLFNAVDNHIKTWMNHLHNGELSSLHVYPFITSLMKSFEKVSLKNSPKISIYTGDENFMISLLTAIRSKLDKFPRPASRLVFELLSRQEGETKRYFLRVLFNGRDITFNIPLCNRRSEDDVCRLKYFTDYHTLNFKNMFSKFSYAEKCRGL